MLVSGAALAVQGPAWWHVSRLGHFVNSVHLWSVELFMAFMVSHSDNADAQIWGIMALLSLGLVAVPFLPGVRSLPRRIPVHRLIWRAYYRG